MKRIFVRIVDTLIHNSLTLQKLLVTNLPSKLSLSFIDSD